MKILVTGSDGLLGNAFKKIGNFTFDSVFDLLSPKKTKLLFEVYQPEIVIHCAALVGGVKRNKEQTEEMYYENMVMNANVVHYAAKFGVKKFVGFGSNCAFADEINETSIHCGQPYRNNQSYGYAKRMLDIHLQAAKDQYGMDYMYVVPVSMFGPHDNFNLDNAHVIPSLIHKCYTEEKLSVWGDGSPIREVVFAEDVAKIVMDNLEKKQYLIIGSGQQVSIKQMADTIAGHFHKPIVWEKDKPQGQIHRTPAKKYDYAYTPFKDAIIKTCEWFKENYPNIRK